VSPSAGAVAVVDRLFFAGAALILYFFFGHLIQSPLLLRHPAYDIAFVMTYMGMNTTEGAFACLADGVEKLYLLVVFAAVMIGCGMTALVTEMGKVVGRSVRGGAAFPAIVGSALEGMVMGAAVTNVVMSGKLTIPMMKRYGFEPEFAAVEVAASTAGQIIPPVMGLAAFIMARPSSNRGRPDALRRWRPHTRLSSSERAWS
jgi:TRAP-type uncharacterized transport system fused permease subunit